ncbi:MAG TPA: hypothetical protein VF635_06220 [Propionibacteriaceae bacterium]
MPWLRTDDGPRKLRAVWLGPSGSTLPFQWTYVQWAVTLCAIPLGIGLLWLAMAAVGIPVAWIWPFAVPWGGTFAVYLAIRVMAPVTFDEPLRYHQRLLRGEWSATSSAPHRALPVQVQWDLPKIGYLSTNTLQAMQWLQSDQRPARSADAGDRVPIDDETDDEKGDRRSEAAPREHAEREQRERERVPVAAAARTASATPWWQREQFT